MSGSARLRMPLWVSIALVLASLGSVLPAAAASLPTGGSGTNAVADSADSPGGMTATGGTVRRIAKRTIRAAGKAAIPPTCVSIGGQAAADDLMNDRYTFPPHRTVTLPHNLTWSEDPLHDNNWRFQYHSMGWVLALVFAWKDTGNKAYRKRAVLLAKSWVRKNPKTHPPSDMSWNDHATALRTIAFSCLARMLPDRQDWLQNAIAVHGATLANPNFYVYTSNHALNQNIGLLEAGCWLNRSSWEHLAANRISTLLPKSVDTQGASNERSVYYEWYNFRRYNLAKDRLQACGQTVSGTFSRIDKMPRFLAFATMPNGRYLNIGDGRDQLAGSIPGTVAEFAATAGASGPKPDNTITVYDAGWVFGRSGWGETRPFVDESMFSIRYGPSDAIHAHRDGSAVTFYGDGNALLVDPGIKDFQKDKWRFFFESRAAHNVMILPGHAERSSWTTTLQRSKVSKRAYDASLNVAAYSGVTLTRRVVFSKRLGFMVVDDSMSSSSSWKAVQLWHAPIGRKVKRNGADTWTRGTGGDVLVRQLINSGSTSVVKGSASPLQGWLPNGWGKVASAPVIERTATGSSVRFLTLLVPFSSNLPEVSVTNLTTGKNAFTFRITIGKHSQKVVATPTGVKITDLD